MAERKFEITNVKYDEICSEVKNGLDPVFLVFKEGQSKTYKSFAYLGILNFNKDSLQQSFVDASSEFDSNAVIFVKCLAAGGVNFLYHMHLNLSQQESGNPIDLDELDSHNNITSHLDKNPNTEKESEKYTISND